MSLPVPQLVKQIKAAHDAAFLHAQKSVASVLECGRLLRVLKAQLSFAEAWVDKVEEIGIAKRTADRYIAVADCAAKQPAKVKYLLEQGASLVDLYRAFDLVKPLQVGPYKTSDYIARKDREAAQLDLPFSYEHALPHIRALVVAKNVEELSESTRRRLLTEVEAAAHRLRESLKDSGAIELTKDHQP